MMQLIMVKIGATPKGRLIEQHDIFFGVVNHLQEIIPLVDNFWQEVAGKWHIDAWRMVNRVGDFHIKIVPKTENNLNKNKLFFINLGGYLPNQFEEFHYKTLVVAENMAQATTKVKQSKFYQHYTFDNTNSNSLATSHIDNKQELIIDDVYCVEDLLPQAFALQIEPLNDKQKKCVPEDLLNIGYISLQQLHNL